MTGLVETYGMRHAAKALAEYDATEADREKLYAAITARKRTPGGAQRAYERWNNAVAKADLAVKKAFYEDTRDRNPEDCVKFISLAFVREMVKQYPPK